MFSRLQYTQGDVVATFKGEQITHEERLRREDVGRGGYCVYLNRDFVLDCYENNKNGTCMASVANSTRQCYDTVTRSMAVANCELVPMGNGAVRVKCKARVIKPFTELW